MISVGLVGLVVSLGTLVSGTARGAFMTTSSTGRLEARVKAATDRIVQEFASAAAGTLEPQLDGFVADSDQISMQQVIAIVDGAAVLGDVLTLEYRQDPADPEDGEDNDGDGLIDEGRLVMTRDNGGGNVQSVTICSGVRRYLQGETGADGDENNNGLTNESGFLIQREGNLITLQLTLVEAWGEGQLTERTSTTSVILKN